MIFSRTDCVPSNLIEFISYGFNLTANLLLIYVNKFINVIGTNVLNIKETTYED